MPTQIRLLFTPSSYINVGHKIMQTAFSAPIDATGKRLKLFPNRNVKVGKSYPNSIEKKAAPKVDSPFVQATTAIAQGNKKLSFVSIQLTKPRLVPFSPKPFFERIAVLFRKRQLPEFYTKYFQD